MKSRSLTILTRGHIAKNAITYITSGYILKIEEIPIPIISSNGGIDDRKNNKQKENKKQKIIKITIYINGKTYIEKKIVDENIIVKQNNIEVILRENKKPIIKLRK